MSHLRLGLDVGSNSIGWCLFRLDGNDEPVGVAAAGVVIFPDGRDPQSGTSLAVDRRLARGARRNRDRFLRRRGDLMAALIRHGLMPEDETARKELERLDPYELRARGLDERLELGELGRAIFHLHQRRGFKSNRRTESGDDAEAGKIKMAVAAVRERMAESDARTFGEYLARLHTERKGVRARLNGQGAKAQYELYSERAMAEEEFDALWAAQIDHGVTLTNAAREELHCIMFRQRPLKPVGPGKCALDPTDERAPWALPLAQRFRILQDLGILKVELPDRTKRALNKTERDILLEALLSKEKVTLTDARRRLRLAEDETLNLESAGRDHLKGDLVAAKMSSKNRFGKAWRALDPETQTEIVERWLAEEEEGALATWLQEKHGLPEEAALTVERARLPDRHCRLGRCALAEIVPIMEHQGLRYDEAVREANPDWHHSDRRPDGTLDRLPYYGEALQRHVSGSGDLNDPMEKRLGRIPNPTVHIGLNQLRKLVNEIAEAYGKPDEIVVELARELKLSKEQKDKRTRENKENKEANDRRRDQLRELGEADNGENRLRLRLWEELNPDSPHDRRCPYTGQQISIHRLFSNEVHIDHILPFAATLDNSAANRVVCLRRSNNDKAKRSPADAFMDNPRYDWAAIQAQSEAFPKNKRWRFAPDAMEQFEASRSFLDRQLTDTAYLARVTREYLGHICPNVWVVPGRLTEMLRGKWGLNGILFTSNTKERTDHRHHAIDAFVVGVTTRSMLQRVAGAAGESRDRLIDDMPDPFLGWDYEAFRTLINGVVVSHKPDHGKQGRLHDQTAYGRVKEPEKEEGKNLVSRKPLVGLNDNQIARIRDLGVRRRLLAYLEERKAAGVTAKAALEEFSHQTGIRRVRVLEIQADIIWMKDGNGIPYKAYSPGKNHCIDIYQLSNGKWAGEAITVFQANQSDHDPRWQKRHPDAEFMFRVHKGDLLRVEGGAADVWRVAQLEISANRLRLAGHHDGGTLDERHKSDSDPFRWLFLSISKMKERKVRPVRVDIVGRLHDPGPFA